MILDVGCGNNPKGTVNIDVEIKHNIENFIKADAQNLPFKTNAFSESISDHAIEHVINVENMVAELKRVTYKKITIFTPLLFSYGFRELLKKKEQRKHKQYFLPSWFKNRGFKTKMIVAFHHPLIRNKKMVLPLPFFYIHATIELH